MKGCDWYRNIDVCPVSKLGFSCLSEHRLVTESAGVLYANINEEFVTSLAYGGEVCIKTPGAYIHDTPCKSLPDCICVIKHLMK